MTRRLQTAITLIIIFSYFTLRHRFWRESEQRHAYTTRCDSITTKCTNNSFFTPKILDSCHHSKWAPSPPSREVTNTITNHHSRRRRRRRRRWIRILTRMANRTGRIPFSPTVKKKVHVPPAFGSLELESTGEIRERQRKCPSPMVSSMRFLIDWFEKSWMKLEKENDISPL